MPFFLIYQIEISHCSRKNFLAFPYGMLPVLKSLCNGVYINTNYIQLVMKTKGLHNMQSFCLTFPLDGSI